MKTKKLLLLILLPFLSSCTETIPYIITTSENELITIYTPEGVVERVTLQTFWTHLPEGNKWTYFTQRAIAKYGQGLLSSTPRDVVEYCPRYPELSRTQRGDFWVDLISKLAYFESSYNPQTSYVELFYDNNGNPVVSRGLLQISKESANGANYRCGIRNEKELHDPKTNLECGVRILNKWVTNDGVIAGKEGDKWRGAARYWSPFRDQAKKAKIADALASLPLCH